MNVSERKHRIAATLTRTGPVIGLGVEQAGEAFGIAGLDQCLPAHGLPKGAVSEILSARGRIGTGAISLLAPLMARLTQAGRRVVIVDGIAEVNPAALAASGVDLAHLVLLRPERAKDALWVTDLCAKNSAVALTLAALENLRELDLRHLQISSESGGGACVLLRPSHAAASAAAALRLRVRPLAGPTRRVGVEFLRVRGAFPPAPLSLEIDDRGPTMALRTSTAERELARFASA